MEDFNHFGEAAKAFHTAISQVVRKTAFDGLANSQVVIRSNGQIKTGFMINSGYVVTHDESTYGNVQQPGEKQQLLPEIDKAENDLTAYWAFGALYSIFQEMGTRFLPARPFVAPGAEVTREPFEKSMSLIEDKMRGMM